MKRKRVILRICLFFVLLFSIVSQIKCRKEIAGDSSGNLTEDSLKADILTNDALVALDESSIGTPKLREIIGYYGVEISRPSLVLTKAGDLVNKILVNCQQLSEMKDSVLFPSEGANKPEHKGIAYSFGQKDFDSRLPPPDGNDLHKSFQVYGVDCSGFLASVLRKSGLDVVKNGFSTAVVQTKILEALQKSLDYSTIELEDLGLVATDQLESGDIVLWRSSNINESNHVGVFARLSSGKGVMFNSNGTGKPETIERARKNWDKDHGIHTIDFDKVVGIWKQPYRVFRFTEDVKVITRQVVGIGQHEALSGGMLSGSGVDKIISKGVCFSNSPNPDFSSSNTDETYVVGDFISKMEYLTPNTQYFVRAFVVLNSGDVFFGNEVKFVSLADYGVVLRTFVDSSQLTTSSVKVGALVDKIQTDPVFEVGVCFSEGTGPTVDSTRLQLASRGSVAAYFAVLGGLKSRTRYYIRAFAIGPNGVTYGDQKEFTTK